MSGSKNITCTAHAQLQTKPAIVLFHIPHRRNRNRSIKQVPRAQMMTTFDWFKWQTTQFHVMCSLFQKTCAPIPRSKLESKSGTSHLEMRVYFKQEMHNNAEKIRKKYIETPKQNTNDNELIMYMEICKHTTKHNHREFFFFKMKTNIVITRTSAHSSHITLLIVFIWFQMQCHKIQKNTQNGTRHK